MLHKVYLKLIFLMLMRSAEAGCVIEFHKTTKQHSAMWKCGKCVNSVNSKLFKVVTRTAKHRSQSLTTAAPVVQCFWPLMSTTNHHLPTATSYYFWYNINYLLFVNNLNFLFWHTQLIIVHSYLFHSCVLVRFCLFVTFIIKLGLSF